MAAADAFDQLALIAEISAALLGFIAVFLVFSNKEGRFAESDRHFIQALVLTGTLAIILALVPRGLSFFVNGEEVWEVSLIVAIVLAAVNTPYQVWSQLKMSKEEAARIHWGWHVTLWGMGSFVIIFLVVGILGLANAMGMYTAATSFTAMIALGSFIAVVFRKFF